MKYFTLGEFECKCGCGEADMDDSLLAHLDYAREVADVPFVITSGYRCVTHNYRVGGKHSSAHLTGNAVDIAAESSGVRYRIVMALLAAGFHRIGISDGFVHVDNDPSKPSEVMWTY